MGRGRGSSSKEAFRDIAVKLTEKAIEGLGGLERFVKSGDVVWVKPNIGWDRTPELAANTNPDVVATIVRLCFEAGAKKVKVGDNPCTAPRRPISTAASPRRPRPLGAEVLFLDESRVKTHEHPGRAGQEDPDLSGDHRMRPGDQRARRQAPRALPTPRCA